MTNTYGTDYAFSPHPPVGALKAAGVQFVCRYISSFAPNDTNGKNLLPGEAKTLLAAGLKIVVVVEEGASRMKAGHNAGAQDAAHADAVTKALAMNGTPIHFACDFDATPADQQPINAYLDGAASVIGRQRTGLYGGYWPVKRALDAGKAHYAWQTLAWSGGQWDPRAQLRQALTVTIGGVVVDVDHARAADYGQWPRRVPPLPGAGPYLQHTKAGDTWAAIAAARNTTIEHLAKLSAAEQLPAGVPYRTTNP